MLEMHVKMVQGTVSDFLPRHNFQKVKNKTLLWTYGDIFGGLQKQAPRRARHVLG